MLYPQHFSEIVLATMISLGVFCSLPSLEWLIQCCAGSPSRHAVEQNEKICLISL